MDERFPDEFVTWNHKTFAGIKVNEVFGMDSKTGRAWLELARQIYCEENDNFYRVINHFDNNAPYLEDYPGRISITHTNHLFAVATLPKTPEVALNEFNPRSAMGIDAESLDRGQVLKVRDKFLSEEELNMIPAENITENILAWTAKEAIIKASLFAGINYKDNIKLLRLPKLLDDPLKGNVKDFGEALLLLDANPCERDSSNEEKREETFEMKLFSYKSYGCAVTIAFSPKCAKFGK